MISLIIPTTSKNRNYTDNLLSNIQELYPDIEIIVEENDLVTLGQNYNNAVARATGDKIILLHNDMVLSPGFVEIMDKHIQPNRITTYTRIEPPIYNDVYPGKVILDCGSDLETFNETVFNTYQSNLDTNLYLAASCKWYIAGAKETAYQPVYKLGVVDLNTTAITELQKTLPGISQKLTNPLQFYTDTDFVVPRDINLG